MRLTTNFSLRELTRSRFADRNKIKNNPSQTVIDRLREVAETLEEIRATVGRPLMVTSGYRSPAVNRAVGGTPSSAHVAGWAVDYYCSVLSVDELAAATAATLPKGALRFDQIIVEGARHVLHLSIAPPCREQWLEQNWTGQKIRRYQPTSWYPEASTE